MGGFVNSVLGGAGKIISNVGGAVEDVVSGVGGAVEDVVSGIGKAGQEVIDTISSVGAQLDDFVNESIPGGWITVGLAAYGYYGSEAAAGSATGSTATTTASATTGVEAGSLVSGTAPVAATDTVLAQATAGSGAGGVTGSAITDQVANNFAEGSFRQTLASQSGGLKGTMAATEGFSLAPTVSNTATASGITGGSAANLTGASLTSPSTWLNSATSMGGAQGLTIPAASGTGILSAGGITAPVAATTVGSSLSGYSTTDALAAKGGLDTVTGGPKQPTQQEIDNPQTLAAILSLIYKRRGESLTRRDATTQMFAEGGVVQPMSPTATMGVAQQTAITPDILAPTTTAGTTQQAIPTTGVVATTAAPAPTVAAQQITPATAQTGVEQALAGVTAAQGEVSKAAQAQAATTEPTTTAVSGLTAAQGQAGQVAAPTQRVAQAGEMVSGATVDQAKVEEALAKNVAAQGTVGAEMTVQGQLNTLLTNFDAGNPPPWAAGTMRTAMATLAARGLGASSLAGQAVIQAALEAATPIAAADAKVYEQMGLVNLSNRQALALTTAQQRAAFLGQEFDQNFQTKVLNAAKISDIANKNFDATVQIALENARITSNMDVANLSAKNALVLANAAQIANLETTNLNNRQQVAVQNAQAFLQMDMANLNAEQQTNMFKAQTIASTIVSDTASINAAKAVNATNALDAEKVNAQLALTSSQFNTAEINKTNIFNKQAADEIMKFNSAEANDRADFNANLATQINLANAKVLADISTANTREVNAIAAVNAKNATDLSASTYAQLSQSYRDQLEQAWKTGDNTLTRANDIAKTTITANATKYSAEQNADAQFYSAVGSTIAKMTTTGSNSLIDKMTAKLGQLIG